MNADKQNLLHRLTDLKLGHAKWRSCANFDPSVLKLALDFAIA
jgi:hypothetical protein